MPGEHTHYRLCVEWQEPSGGVDEQLLPSRRVPKELNSRYQSRWMAASDWSGLVAFWVGQ